MLNNNEPSSGDTMSARLPEATRLLKDMGVHTLLASYVGPLLAVVFTDKNEVPMPVAVPYRHYVDIAQVFRALIRKRHPGAFASGTETGSFEWDLSTDSLEHQHVINHFGL